MSWMGSKLAEFGDLWPAERKLIDEMAGGRTVVIGPGVPPEDAGRELRLRASFLRYLALGGCEDCRPPENGVRVRGAYVEGDGPEEPAAGAAGFEPARWEGSDSRGLDFEGCKLERNLLLHFCRIPDLVRLYGARVESLSFSGSHLADGIAGDSLEARGWLFLYDVQVTGEIRLAGASLGGGLDCSGGTFQARRGADGTPGPAFGAAWLKTGGTVFMRGSKVTGEVQLGGAQIGGDFDCSESTFQAEKDGEGKLGPAISADGLKAGGSVFLRKATATGEVRLVIAQIGGILDCIGGKFTAEADVDGRPGRALNLDSMRVGGAFFLNSGAKVDGVLDLTAAEVGTLNDEKASWPGQGLLLLDRFRYGAITSGPVDATDRLDWLDRQDPQRWGADFWPQPYQQLAQVLRDTGHDGEAQAVLIEKERRLREVGLARLTGWQARAGHRLYTFLQQIVDYGYRPQRALGPALILIAIGTLAAGWAARAGLLVAAEPAKAGAPAVELVPLFYAFEAFVPIIRLGQVDAFRIDMATSGGRLLQIFQWAYGLAGWVIGGVAAAGVLGLFRRG